MTPQQSAATGVRDLLRHTIVPLFQTLLGRKRFARFARLLTLEARLDGGGDDIRENGELRVLRGVLGHLDRGSQPVLFDVGANRGDWTTHALGVAGERRMPGVRVYAFEPTPGTRELLSARLRADKALDRVSIVPTALSDRTGESTFNVFGAGEGRNSLSPSATSDSLQVITVRCDTIDAFSEQQGIDHIDLLKVDAEGHDLFVLRGAARMLARRAITCIQFEYNQQWIESRVFLRDAFDLLVPHGYHIGKVTRVGVEVYDRWHFELESWRHANYFAWVSSGECPVPTFQWWNV